MTEIIDVGIKLDTGDVIFKASDAERMFHRLGQSAEEMQGRVRKSNDAFRAISNLFATFVSVGSIIKFFRDLTSATIEHEQASLRLNAVLRATGNQVGLTAMQIETLSQGMARRSMFSSEQIMEAAGTLASFRTIVGDTFTEALQRSADLAALWHTDVTSAALQLGRALGEPTTGMMALSRSGVAFSSVERKNIQEMAEHGRMAEAQAAILLKVKERTDGLAAAMAVGLAGGMKQARTAYNDFLASLGQSQQIGSPIEGLFRGIAEFFRSRELTTDPIEDYRIEIEKLETAAFATTEAMRNLALQARGMPVAPTTLTSSLVMASAQQKATTGAGVNLFVSESNTWADLMRQLDAGGRRIQMRKEEVQRLIDKIAEQRKAEADEATANALRTQQALSAAAAAEAERSAAEKFVEALQTEAATLGMSEAEIRRYTIAHTNLTAKQRDAATASADAIDAYEANKRAVEGLRQSYADWNAAMETAETRLKDQVRELEIEKATFGMSAEDARQYRFEIEAIAALGNTDFTRSVIERARSLNTELAALRANQEAWDEYVKKIRRADEEREREAQKTTIQWKRAKENMQDIFADFISDTVMAKAAFEDFVKAVLDMWIRMMAQVAAASFFKALSGLGGNPWGPMAGGAHDSIGMDSQRVALGAPGGLVVPARAGSVQPSMTLHQTVQFNIQALDQRGVAQIIREQKGEIAAIVLKATQESQGFRSALARG